MENGFRVERRLANSIKNYETLMRNDSNFSELFVKPDGSLAVTGDLVVNRKLAATLRVLAADPNSFYSGALAQQIVDDIKDYGGNITLQDLQGYNTTIKDPIKVTLRNGNYTLYNPPPPSGGAVLDFIVGILDGYNFTEDDVSDVNRTTLTYHRIVEAFKFAYAKRSRLGDMDFINITELVSNLTSADFAASIRQQINDTTTREVFFYQPDFVSVENHGTAHINVLAPDGSAVAMTSTINYFFGAQVRGSRTGIVFNDQMDDFSTPGVTNVFGFPPSPNNFIVPGKIPQSSMCPTIVFDSSGEVAFLGGGVGGSRITTQVAFVMMGSLWFKRDLLTADDTGRIHHQLVPNEIVAERWLDSAIVAGLRAKGHTVNVLQPPNDYIAFVNTVRVKCPPRNAIGSDVASNMTSCIEAIVDGRHGGIPDGV
jgi:gamma-glutamyltranspeptidase/glutathione hydrolase/leukotriene-C4 hydrolase